MNVSMDISMDIAQVRAEFPAIDDKAYFNYGGQGPMATTTLTAITEAFQQVQQLGPFSSAANRWVTERSQSLRRSLAGLLGVAPSTVALTEDVTVGCNIALWGLDWQPGDEILLSDCEHQGVIGAAQELARRFGVGVSTYSLLGAQDDKAAIAAVTTALRPQTRLVVLSHILWNTGLVLPLGAIAQACQTFSQQHPSQRPLRILVDAAQSVGTLPLALAQLPIDFYAFTGHKWLCGPEGVGGLYIRPEAMAELSPTLIGWRSVVTDAQGQPQGWQPNASRYEVATSAYPLYAGLEAAIAAHPGSNLERYQRITQLSGQLWQRLRDISGVRCLLDQPPQAGLVSFQLEALEDPGRSPQQLVQALEAQGIFTRTLLNPHCVRAGVHYFTREAEVDRLVSGVEAFLRTHV